MNTYRITYKDGNTMIVKANTALEVVKKYDLATKENIGTRFEQLSPCYCDTIYHAQGC
jgi:hypothetical protein